MLCARFALSAVLLGLYLAASVQTHAAIPETAPDGLGQEVSFQTADGVTLYGDFFRGSDRLDVPVLLFFHQGGSNARAEYELLVGRLLARGYHTLAIDQRRGGTRLGGTNRTVDALGDETYTYCDAYPDLEAALRFIQEAGYTGPIIAWGSSYSGALALRLAIENPDAIRGVLAFSPASSAMDGCEPRTEALTVPALVLRPSGEMEIESVAQQLQRFRREGLQTYVAPDGVHGSSMLNRRRVRGDVEPTWAVVLQFLDDVLGS